jgi:DNA-binding transcriptional ArsR family regulator
MGDSRAFSVQMDGCTDPEPGAPRDARALVLEQSFEYSAGSGRGAGLRVDAAHQEVDATTGRIATCPYSWMQAVHWVAGSGLYAPSWAHGPKWGETTVRLAQELSALTECRPGIAYLMRKLGVSERTIQYHLAMLREAGLLVYRTKGTRKLGGERLASVFERVIPVEFDRALGIRTTGEGITRRPVGIADEGRGLMGKLARKAARKVRRTRSRGKGRCTSMQVATPAVSTGRSTPVPSEEKLASGDEVSPTVKKAGRGRGSLNRVGRRYRLALQLVEAVSWLGKASVPRLAWLVRHVADAGWTCAHVQAFLALGGKPEDVRRPSGMLAHRLKGAHLLWDTEAKRQQGTEAWRDLMLSKKAPGLDWQGTRPERGSVQALLAEAVARTTARDAAGSLDVEAGQAPAALEGLTADVVTAMRIDAVKDPSLILTTIDMAGEAYARRLYTHQLVDRALKPASATTVIDWQEGRHG